MHLRNHLAALALIVALATGSTYHVYLDGGTLWVSDGKTEIAVEHCCPAALPAVDRAMLEAGVMLQGEAALTAFLENFCS